MIRKFLSYTLVATLLLAVSCISEDGTKCPETDVEKITLSFKLDMGLDGASTGTRSRADEPNSYGTSEGNFEKISSLRVIILHGTDREVEGARLVATNDNGTPRLDNLEFSVKSNETKTILLIANEDALPAPEGSGMDDAKDFLDQFLSPGVKISEEQWETITNWTATLPEQDNTGATLGLFSNEKGEYPAYGLPLTELFRVYASTELAAKTTADEYRQEVTLFLTRAAAKARFSFYVDKNPQQNPYLGKGMYVTGIRLNGIDRTEYVFPKNTYYSPAKYITNADGIEIPNFAKDGERYITSFTPVPGATKSDFILDIANTPVEIKSYDANIPTCGPIYFPESMCAEGKNYTVQVRVGTPTNPGEWITAKENDGALIDNILNVDGHDAIARNTYLDIEIYFGEIEITCKVTVVPYDNVTLNPEFGFSPPITDKLIIAPTLTLDLNDPEHREALLEATYEATSDTNIGNLVWVSSDASIILLGNKETDENSQLYIKPSESIELALDEKVRVIPQKAGTAKITVYSQTGLVATCNVTVK